MNAEKLNETISELETAMNQIVALKNVYNKIEENNSILTSLMGDVKETAENQDEVVDKLEKQFKQFEAEVFEKIADNEKSINNISADISAITTKYDRYINDFEEKFDNIIKEIYVKFDENDKSLENLSNEVKATIEKQDEVIKHLKQEFNTLKDDIDRSLRLMKEENREQQLQLSSKIERVASDLQVEMRKGNDKLEEKITDVSNSISALDTNINALHKKQFIVSLCILGVSIAAIVVGIII